MTLKDAATAYIEHRFANYPEMLAKNTALLAGVASKLSGGVITPEHWDVWLEGALRDCLALKVPPRKNASSLTPFAILKQQLAKQGISLGKKKAVLDAHPACVAKLEQYEQAIAPDWRKSFVASLTPEESMLYIPEGIEVMLPVQLGLQQEQDLLGTVQTVYIGPGAKVQLLDGCSDASRRHPLRCSYTTFILDQDCEVELINFQNLDGASFSWPLRAFHVGSGAKLHWREFDFGARSSSRHAQFQIEGDGQATYEGISLAPTHCHRRVDVSLDGDEIDADRVRIGSVLVAEPAGYIELYGRHPWIDFQLKILQLAGDAPLPAGSDWVIETSVAQRSDVMREVKQLVAGTPLEYSVEILAWMETWFEEGGTST